MKNKRNDISSDFYSLFPIPVFCVLGGLCGGGIFLNGIRDGQA